MTKYQNKVKLGYYNDNIEFTSIPSLIILHKNVNLGRIRNIHIVFQK